MSYDERGAYTPPTTDAPLSFDARQPVRGARPIPFTLIVSVLVLTALVAAIFVFYRSGVRQAGQPPQAVGASIDGMKSAATAEAQPQDPAAGLQIYRSDAPGEAAPVPQFTAPPEQPQPRPAPTPVVIAPPTPAPVRPVAAAASGPPASAPALRPSLAPAPVAVAPAPKVPAPKAPAPKVLAPAPVAAAPAPKAAAGASAAVQIGAFSSQALADRGWADASAIAPGLTAGKGKSVQQIDKDGATLYRTAVTGFASRADATAFCNQLKAAGKSCFVR
ncbi:SPOR domain-containing protein [Phenylobacterium sp.]|uniref:cell division protein FtsN n=1 Tax=Phenylobacterium sp. TaxID=1871053 RepID=UPI003983941E